MKISFNQIKIHNFLSIGDASVLLKDKGYCLVTGVNNCPADLAISNGSGKSSVWSAICYALTGETIQGLHSNITNIFAQDGCFVELEFTVDNADYIITRYKDYGNQGTDLKIKINGEDKSGKGVRESQALLEQYLPDLTSELIGSVVILGQGLPHKFSSNTPAGRKAMLEKLSKSDFMIQDIKERLAQRSCALNQKQRAIEDLILKKTTQKEMSEQQLAQTKTTLQTLNIPKDFAAELKIKNKQLVENSSSLEQTKKEFAENNITLQALNTKLNECLNAKSTDLAEELKAYTAVIEEDNQQKTNLETQIRTLELEIKKLESITDICPTCGQKLPNVIKPDTKNQKAQLNILYQDRKNFDTKYNAHLATHKTYVAEIEKNYENNKAQFEIDRNNLQKISIEFNTNIAKLNSNISNITLEISQLKQDETNFLTNKQALEKAVLDLENQLKKLDAEILYNITEKNDVLAHIDILDKMNTLVKRDFRGFLLTDVIAFIDQKAKEYCQDVFSTSDLNFVLSGNNIDITYCGRMFENLSGGEKQKVDLIIQFAIRDMMSQYLDFRSNILVLDEIFDQLDIIGCTNILNLISKKLQDIESIFIISHRAELEIPYDDIITVIKGEDGISRVK